MIRDVLESNHARLTRLPKNALSDLADQLFAVRLINSAVKENPSMIKFIDEFKAIVYNEKELQKIQEHCQKFLNSFIAVEGSYDSAARIIHKDLISHSSEFNIVIEP